MKKLFLLVVLIFGFLGFTHAGTETFYLLDGVNSYDVKGYTSYSIVPLSSNYGITPSQKNIPVSCELKNVDLTFDNAGGSLSLRLYYYQNGGGLGYTSCTIGTAGTGLHIDDLVCTYNYNSRGLASCGIYRNWNNVNTFAISGTIIYSGFNVGNCPACPDCPTCPEQYTSLQCQTEYSLIPVSSVDQNYCVSNDLCPVSTGNCAGSGDMSWSALYINQIQHVSAGIINISIPDEISWDYTSDEDEFNLDIEGYNVDTEYIEGIINNQNSKPTTEDLNNIISGVLPLFIPGLVIILFIYFVFRFLKKIF